MKGSQLIDDICNGQCVSWHLYLDMDEFISILDKYDINELYEIWLLLDNRKIALMPYVHKRIKDFSEKYFD